MYTVDGSEILHQLRLVGYLPLFTTGFSNLQGFSTIPGGFLAGCPPSTVLHNPKATTVSSIRNDPSDAFEAITLGRWSSVFGTIEVDSYMFWKLINIIYKYMIYII